ncbi:hypothetical protein EYF80_049772 [Liparis tanakae]|uniref:Uncharacterized protein n=1 Tax=Liparis tanakae TaxID=230148 RepID=A0A4Z2FFW8_9TELE|nr:hypothetical protein EYF80_049772 [Liparis tanakae]
MAEQEGAHSQNNEPSRIMGCLGAAATVTLREPLTALTANVMEPRRPEYRPASTGGYHQPPAIRSSRGVPPPPACDTNLSH